MKKITVVIFIILLLINVLTSASIIDEHHIHTCKQEHCIKCIIINNAIKLIKNILFSVFKIIIINVFILVITYIFNCVRQKQLETLLDKKVQFNE